LSKGKEPNLKVLIWRSYLEKMERADNGKLYVTDPVFSIDCGGLGTPFLTHLLLYVKRSLKVLPCLG
jgi:hypothetical protein